MAVEKNSNPMTPSRRDFVQAGIGLSAAGLAAMASVNKLLAADTQAAMKTDKPLIKPGEAILFQGDSITDAGRKRHVVKPSSDVGLGRGYAWLAAAELLIGMPDANLKIYNRGNSGNKVYQLAERWERLLAHARWFL